MVFDGAVNLPSLDVAAADINGGSIVTSGHQAYGTVVLGSGGTTLSDSAGGAITFAGTIDGAGTLATITSGATTFEGVVGGATALATLVVQGPTIFNIPTAATNAAGFSVRTGGPGTAPGIGLGIAVEQNFVGSVVLRQDTALATADGGNIEFDGTINAAAPGAAGLSVTAGRFTYFGQSIGSLTPLSSLTLSSQGTTLIEASITTASGGQAFGNVVELDNDVTLTDLGGGNISFGGPLNGFGGLTVATSGATRFNAAVGGQAAYLRFLSIASSGGTTTIAAPVSTIGDQTYGEPVVAAGLDTLFTSAGATVQFLGTVDGTHAFADGLVIPDAATVFDGRVGGVTPLSSITNQSGGTVFRSSVTAGTLSIALTTLDLNGGTIQTSAGANLGSVGLLSDSSVIDSGGGTITILGADGGHNLTVGTTGDVSFGASVGGTIPLASLTVADAPHSTVLESVTTTGAETYSGPTMLFGDVQAGGNVLFASTVTGAAITVGGTTTFDSAVSASSLALHGATLAVTGGTIFAVNGQSYAGPVTLATDATLSSTGGNITFASTIDGAHKLSVGTPATASFGGSVGSTIPLASVTVADAAGTAVLAGGAISTTGDQTFAGSVALGAVNSLDVGGTLLFAGKVTGGALSVLGGATTFEQAVTIGTLSVGAATLALGGGSSIVTTLGQTYHGPVTLAADATLTAAGAPVVFADTIDGPHGLTILGAPIGNATSFGGSIGSVTPLASLTTGYAVFTAAGSVTTSASQTYNGDVGLAGNEAFASAGQIAFNGVVNGPTLVATAGSVTLNGVGLSGLSINGSAILDAGAYGIGNPAQSYTFTGPVTLNGTLTFAQPMVFGGAVTLVGDTMLSAGGGVITFAGTIDGAGTLVSNTSGATTFEGVVGGATALATLLVQGPTIFDIPTAATNAAGFSVRANGPAIGLAVPGSLNSYQAQQGYLGAVTLVTDTVLTNQVGFGGTVDASSPGGAGLTLTGSVAFNQAVGGISPLSKLVVSSSGSVDILGSITTAGGGQSYGNSNVEIIGSLSFTDTGGGNISFGAPTLFIFANGGNSTFATSGNTRFGGPVFADGNLIFPSTGGTTTIATNSIAAMGQFYGNPVLLEGDTTLTSNTSRTISFGSTVDSSGSPAALTLAPFLVAFEGGNAIIDAAIGGTTPLASLSVSGTTTISAPVTTVAGGQSYGGGVTLAGDTVLRDIGGGAISFSTIEGAHDLRVRTTGETSFNGSVGNVIALTNLAVAGGATISGSSVTTSNGQDYLGAVAFGPSLTLSAGSGTVFGGTVVGGSLTVSSGTTTFDGNVETDFLAAQAATLALGPGGFIGAFNGQTIDAFNGQTYAGPVTLAADATLNTSFGNIVFAGTIDGLHQLIIESRGGIASFGGSVGSATPLASLVVNATKLQSIVFSGGAVVTSTQIYGGPVTLNGSESFTASGGAVLFDAAVTGPGATLTATAGSVMLNGAVLSGLSIIGGAILDAGAYGIGNPAQSYTFTGPVTLNGTLTLTQPTAFAGAVTLASDATLIGTGTVNFNGTVDGGHNLAISADGATMFGGAVGQTVPLASLAVEIPVAAAVAGGEAVLAGGTITTSGTQTYAGQVLLAADTTLRGSSVTVSGTLDSLVAPAALTVAGNASFGGAVGAATPLASLGVTGAAALSVPAVATTGAQVYGGATTVPANVGLSSTGGAAITFSGTLDGPGGVAVGTTGPTTFDGIVGGTTALAYLEVTPGPTLFDIPNAATAAAGFTVRTGGPATIDTILPGRPATLEQGFGGPVTLAGNTVFMSSDGGNVVFAGTVDASALGGASLSVAGAGTATFGMSLGGTVPLASLGIDAHQIDLGGTATVLGNADLSAAQGIAGTIIAGQSIALSAGTVSGGYTAPQITVAAPTVAGNYVTQVLTVQGANSFNITGSIANQSGAAGAANIVFVGGTAEATGTFNGLSISGATLTAAADLFAAGTDVQTDATEHIVAPIAAALADPDAPLGVGAAVSPAAGGATAQDLNAIVPTSGDESDGDDARAKAAKRKAPSRMLRVFDYVNRFLDASLGRP
jgi:hypothetical protein